MSKKWRGSVLSNVLRHSAFMLAAAPAGAVEGLFFAVVGIGCGKPKTELQCL